MLMPLGRATLAETACTLETQRRRITLKARYQDLPVEPGGSSDNRNIIDWGPVEWLHLKRRKGCHV